MELLHRDNIYIYIYIYIYVCVCVCVDVTLYNSLLPNIVARLDIFNYRYFLSGDERMVQCHEQSRFTILVHRLQKNFVFGRL